MAETNTSEIIALTKQEGRRDSQPPSAGRRKLVRNAFIQTGVREATIDNFFYCHQLILPGSKSVRWEDYLKEGLKARGAYMENGQLVWFPSKDGLPTQEDVVGMAERVFPKVPVAATFRFGEKPKQEEYSSEISIRSNGKPFDQWAMRLANYFVDSIGNHDGSILKVFKGGEVNPAINSSPHDFRHARELLK